MGTESIEENQPLKNNDKQTTEQQTQKKLSSEEKYNLFILLVLYFIQGIPLGFFGGALSMIMAEKGATYSQLGELSMVFYPFTFKFLTAPFLDSYYFKNFGQRKTYIVPLQYLLAALFILLSYQIEELIENQAIGTLTLYGFVMCFLMAQQDVAVDGWVLTMLSEDFVGYGSTCNNIGQALGSLISSNLFIKLKSVPTNELLIYVAIFIFIVTVWVHFFVKEKKANEEEQQSFLEIVKCLKGFFLNKHLLFYIILLCSYKLGFSPMSATFQLELVKLHYPKETLTTFSTYFIPIGFLTTIIASKYMKKGFEMRSQQVCSFLRLSACIYMYIVLLNFETLGEGVLRDSLIVSAIYIEHGIQYVNFVAQGFFYNRISDVDLGGSYLTVLNSISNLGGQASDSVALELHGMFSYHHVVIAGFVYVVLHYIIMRKKWLQLEGLPKSTFKLSTVAKKE